MGKCLSVTENQETVLIDTPWLCEGIALDKEPFGSGSPPRGWKYRNRAMIAEK